MNSAMVQGISEQVLPSTSHSQLSSVLPCRKTNLFSYVAHSCVMTQLLMSEISHRSPEPMVISERTLSIDLFGMAIEFAGVQRASQPMSLGTESLN